MIHCYKSIVAQVLHHSISSPDGIAVDWVCIFAILSIGRHSKVLFFRLPKTCTGATKVINE